MNFHNDPFFQGAAPPTMPDFSGMGFGRRRHEHPSLALSPSFGVGGGMLMPFGGQNPFYMMNSMMQNMDNMMRNMQRAAHDGQCYSSSSTTVMHYSSDRNSGQPRVYQAATSTRQGPGGVKETRKAVKDSHTGLQKMAVGHHIGERSHVIERQFNSKTGRKEENQEFINLDETDASSFDKEWRHKTQSLNRSLFNPAVDQARRHHISNSRGLPSSLQRPQYNEDTTASYVSSHHKHGHDHSKNGPVGATADMGLGSQFGETERVRVAKRKQRLSTSGEEDGGVGYHHSSVPTRSPKLSRMRSPPYPAARWAPSQSHTSHTHLQSDSNDDDDDLTHIPTSVGHAHLPVHTQRDSAQDLPGYTQRDSAHRFDGHSAANKKNSSSRKNISKTS